ncbi:MAG TPA: RsmE family RNA methyltransferase, partial [Vicinamibacterales bacterium]
APSGAMKLMFVEPAAKASVSTLKSALEYHVPARAEVLLGPEGGWSQEELDAAMAIGCVPVTLGPLTLRAESMAVAALAALAAIWET